MTLYLNTGNMKGKKKRKIKIREGKENSRGIIALK
jgi:hypothetical protein